jgi:redox-sensitive bicupin YhaK (pirin superfamily)
MVEHDGRRSKLPWLVAERLSSGEYDGVKSIVESPRGVTYLDVRLKAGERWTFHPAKAHDVTWIASHQGIVTTPEQVAMGEVAVFEEGDQAIGS